MPSDVWQRWNPQCHWIVCVLVGIGRCGSRLLGPLGHQMQIPKHAHPNTLASLGVVLSFFKISRDYGDYSIILLRLKKLFFSCIPIPSLLLATPPSIELSIICLLSPLRRRQYIFDFFSKGSQAIVLQEFVECNGSCRKLLSLFLFLLLFLYGHGIDNGVVDGFDFRQ